MGLFGHYQKLPSVTNRGITSREKFFVYIRERHKWLLSNGGERVLLYKRKFDGERCPLYDKVRHSSQQHGQDEICYGSGFVGGYYDPVEVMASLVEPGQEEVVVDEAGRKHAQAKRCWTLWEPLLTSGDFIVRKNNQRLIVKNVTVSHWRSYALHQKFEVEEVSDKNSPIYKVGLQP